MKLGVACRLLKIGSVKLNFGTANLAGPAFAATLGAEWADNIASYVLSGRFSADLGALVIQDPSILDKVVAFRESSVGEELRKEVFEKLTANEGADVNVSINSGLNSAFSSEILQRARDNFVRLITPTKKSNVGSTAIWNDIRYAEDALMRWRQRSMQILEENIRRHNIALYDQCPCGSGEKLKFCCFEALAKKGAYA